MVNCNLVAIPVHFSARRDNAELSMGGIDVLRTRDNRIVEDLALLPAPEAEDHFWGAL